jgi:hypothetical protein
VIYVNSLAYARAVSYFTSFDPSIPSRKSFLAIRINQIAVGTSEQNAKYKPIEQDGSSLLFEKTIPHAPHT